MAGVYNFTIERNTDVTKNIVWKDSTGTVVPMTGYTGKFSMRTSAASTTEVYVRQTSDSTMTIDGANGKVTFTIPAATTLTFTAGRYVYDLRVTSAAGVSTRLIQGVITIDPEVTR